MSESLDRLLKSLASRPRDGRYGIGTAAQYLKSLSGCFDGGYCPRAMAGVSGEEWAAALKDAEQKLTFCDSGMNIKGTYEPTESTSLLEFDCVATTTRKDRDGDVLETRGATLDPMAPLLWQHDPFHPIGRVLRRTGQTQTKLTTRCSVLDFGDSDGEMAKLARDAAVLIRGNALRISHGFDPTEYEPLDEKEGRWRVTKFEILELSVVSIPSNTDAVITAFSKGKLHSQLAKSWAKNIHDSRPVQGRGISFEQPAEHTCTCHKSQEVAVSASQNHVAEVKGPTSNHAESGDRIRGQGPQQGDHDWDSRHMPAEVDPANLDNGVERFDVGNAADDAILAIATGSAGRQNPAPDTALAGNIGTADEPKVSAMGSPDPKPDNPTDVAGMAGGKASNVNDAAMVQPMNSDSPAHHDTAGNVGSDVNVDVPGLKAFARQIAHSGKEGSMYLHAERGHVHHVMHPDDMHPDNSHKYHQAHEIAKMYGCCRGVRGVKCAVSHHPMKGSGYKLLHKSGMLPGDDDMLNSQGGDGSDVSETAKLVESLKTLKAHLAFLENLPAAELGAKAKPHVAAAGAILATVLKFSSLDPNGDGGYAAAGVPANDVLNASGSTHLEGVPANNDQKTQVNLTGVPSENGLVTGADKKAADESVGAGGTDPDMYYGSQGTINTGSVSHEAAMMKWLEADEESEVDSALELALAEELLAGV